MPVTAVNNECPTGAPLSTTVGTTSPPPASELLLGVHQAALDPSPQRAIRPYCLAVKKLGQGSLDALVDVEEPRFVRRQAGGDRDIIIGLESQGGDPALRLGLAGQ